MVDEFLAGQSLKWRTDLLALPVAPDLPPPNALSTEARQEWKAFLTYPQHKAFAVSDLGHFAYSYGRSSDKDARKLAMEHCEDAAPNGDHCQLVDTQP
jgi:hypothetical protein